MLDADSGLAAAEQEAEWLREHNAAWVERCQSLSLQPMLDLLLRSSEMDGFHWISLDFMGFYWILLDFIGFLYDFIASRWDLSQCFRGFQRTDASLGTLLETAPPGLMPETLRESRLHMVDLSSLLEAQMAAIEALQADGVALGRTVRSLQAAQKSHRAELRRNFSECVGRKGSERLKEKVCCPSGNPLRWPVFMLFPSVFDASRLRTLTFASLFSFVSGHDLFRRMVTSFEQPLDAMRTGLREQSQALCKARGEVSGLLDGLAQCAVPSAAPAPKEGMSAELQEFLVSEIRQAELERTIIMNYIIRR